MKRLVVIICLLVCSLVSLGEAQDRFEVEPHLVQGDLTAAKQAAETRLKSNTNDPQAQFALGIVATLQAVENLAQNLHRYGLRDDNPRLPFVRLPIPQNPDPEEITYEKWRAVLQQVIDDLEIAQKRLSEVKGETVKLKLPVGLIRLDLDGDGEASDEETFWKVFTAVAWRAAKLSEDQKRFEIGFDRADVHWMIGYTHLLQAMAEAWLAHDTSEFYAQTAPLFFEGAPMPAVEIGTKQSGGFNANSIADAVAAIHLMSFDVTEPKRMAASREHLLSMIQQSRLVWEHAVVETDDDREWIPNANQTSLTPLDVTQERVDGWKQFLDEAEAVLNGERLVPHWRIQRPQGINLKKVFDEPRRFDLVMWAHGAAAIPFLEEGDVVTRETASTLNRIFQGRFVAFAIWFQ